MLSFSTVLGRARREKIKKRGLKKFYRAELEIFCFCSSSVLFVLGFLQNKNGNFIEKYAENLVQHNNKSRISRVRHGKIS